MSSPLRLATYGHYAIALFGAAMTPYEVFFSSSGGVEEGWSRQDLMEARANVLVGFPLGGLLSLSIAGLTAVTFMPLGVEVDTIAQTALPVAVALGQVGLIVGIFAATFGAALETGLSCGYAIAQYFGWQWGKASSTGHMTMSRASCRGPGMRLSEVLDLEVRDSSGHAIGGVADVRLVQDGPISGPYAAGLRISDLVAVQRRHLRLFGYERDVGPWLVRRVIRTLTGRTTVVPWTQVASIGADGVRLRALGSELVDLHEHPGGRRRTDGA